MPSLVLTSLSLGRALADRDALVFRAKGTCMYPTIRPGDVLTIKSCTAAEIGIGDIAVCRFPTFLIGHRVIEKGEQEGRAYIITRSDRRPVGSDPPTFDENLLGVVAEIRRKGKCKPIGQADDLNISSRRHKILAAAIDARVLLRQRIACLANASADTVIYRMASRSWQAIHNPRLTFSVQVPLNSTLGFSVFQTFDAESFDPELPIHGKFPQCFRLALHLDEEREAAGWIEIARNTPGPWRQEEVFIRLRYRGTDLQKKLLAKADHIINSGNS